MCAYYCGSIIKDSIADHKIRYVLHIYINESGLCPLLDDTSLISEVSSSKVDYEYRGGGRVFCYQNNERKLKCTIFGTLLVSSS